MVLPHPEYCAAETHAGGSDPASEAGHVVGGSITVERPIIRVRWEGDDDGDEQS